MNTLNEIQYSLFNFLILISTCVMQNVLLWTQILERLRIDVVNILLFYD